jgi:hypothetical protein
MMVCALSCDELNMKNSENVRIQMLQEEIYYYQTLLEPHDCGHSYLEYARHHHKQRSIHTTISFLKQRIENLNGKKEWPFNK